MKFLLALLLPLMIISCSTQYSGNYSKIEYEAGACFGFCPMFKMTINEDRTAVFEAERFNFSRDTQSQEPEGTFTATIKQEDYNKLVALLNEINVNSLNAKYGNRNVTDLPTAYLRVDFKNGNSKEVEDYGKSGSEKLVELYDFIEELRFNQDWKKIK